MTFSDISGKTTISRLLFRFYDPLEGVVEMGGYDIKRYTQKSIRQVNIYHFLFIIPLM